MKNLDKITNMDTLRANLYATMQNGSEEEQKQAFLDFTEGLQNEIMNSAKANIDAYNVLNNDERTLQNRGLRKQLTSQEIKYFNEAIQRKGFDNIETIFPKTIIEEVFKTLKEEHPILSRVDMTNVDILTQYITSKPTKATAFWGAICEDIKQMILNGFEIIDIKSSRLSGFVPVCKGMLDLGPQWLANYVITVITEIMSASLELAIVQGTGKNQPIGMMKKLSGATDSVYPDKQRVSIDKLDAKNLGAIRGALAEAKTDTGNVVILVHPATYWSKVFPQLAFQTQMGTWVTDKLPTGEEIIKSYAVPKETLIFGDLKNYFLGVASNVKIERYKETLAIEDMDLFIAKFYGYGLAKDKNAFFVADITGIQGGTIPQLEVFAKNTGDNKDSTITNTTENLSV